MTANNKWLASVVREWATALRESGFSKDEAMQAQHYIDMEYSSDFEYSKPYLALRAFFLTADLTPGEEADDHLLSGRPARMIVCAEAAYRMGYDDAMKKAEVSSNATAET